VLLRRLALFLLLAAIAPAQYRFPSRRLQADRRAAVLDAGMEFRAVGVLDGALDARVRASADGAHWTAWQSAEPDSARSGLVYFNTPQRFLEYQRAATSEGAFLFIDPGPTPKIADAPVYITREQWGCTPATCPAKDPPVYTTPTHLIVHHTATANNATDWAAVVRSIWVLHVQGNGWNDIGYNYLVDPNGVLYEGRAGGDGVLGAHFSGVNGGTMGVSMLGTYSTVPASDAALATLRAMLVWQVDKWHIDPLAKQLHASSGLLLDTISGHRDANLSTVASGATECPGNGLYTVLPAIRHAVYDGLAGACPVTLSARNLCAPADGGTLSVGVASACAWDAAGPASWLQPVASAGKLDLAVAPNSGPRRSTTVSVGGRVLSLTQAAAGEAPLPCPAWGGVVSAAEDPAGRPVAPGSIVSIYGANFSAADGKATVTIDGRAAPILFAGPSQINAQLPANTNIGSARAVVSVNGVAGPDAMFSVSEAVPALFVSGAQHAIGWNFDDGRLNAPDAPVRPGGILVIYLTGAGAAALPASATIGGRDARILYLGAAPGLPGVSQANLVVPGGLPAGNLPLVLTVAGAPSAPAAVSIAP
jgi:uncharacterized protein (TIGR03437 family)